MGFTDSIYKKGENCFPQLFEVFFCFPSCDRDHGDGRERYTEREKTYSFHISLERQLKGNIPCLKVKLKLIVEHKTKQNKTQNKAKQNKLK